MTNEAPASLLSLPEEALLNIFSRLPFEELIRALPFVCTDSCRLLRLPQFINGRGMCNFETQAILGGGSRLLLSRELCNLELAEFLCKKVLSVDGEALCKWLHPRVVQLTDFDLPLDALHLRADRPFTPQLLDILPVSLTCLSLQSAWTDKVYQGKAGCTQASSLTSSPAFQACQDPVPYLPAFARLSALQRLTIPVHQGLERSALASLKALRDLQRLHLQLRGIGNQVGCHLLPGGASLSVLTTLTRLSMDGSRVDCVDGLGALPKLQELSISGSASLSLTGLQQSTSLVCLRLSSLLLTQPGPVLLQILQSIQNLGVLVLAHLRHTHQMAPLEVTSLLQLANLRALDVTGHNALGYSKEPMLQGHISPLTSLEFEGLSSEQESAFPALSQLVKLGSLALRASNPYMPIKVPSNLQALHSLKAFIILGANSRHPQELDVSALASLGPSIEVIVMTGFVRLTLTCSLVHLATHPRLQTFMLPDQCVINSEGNSWLHVASLWHALRERPRQGLPKMYMSPNLADLANFG